MEAKQFLDTLISPIEKATFIGVVTKSDLFGYGSQAFFKKEYVRTIVDDCVVYYRFKCKRFIEEQFDAIVEYYLNEINECIDEYISEYNKILRDNYC